MEILDLWAKQNIWGKTYETNNAQLLRFLLFIIFREGYQLTSSLQSKCAKNLLLIFEEKMGFAIPNDNSSAVQIIDTGKKTLLW